MADQRATEVVRICDPTTNSQQASVDSSGRLSAIVIGTLTHNNAVPGTQNLGVLPALANAVAPAYIEGDQVLLSTDLGGALRSTASGLKTHNLASPGADNLGVLPAVATGSYRSLTEGNQVLLSADLDGNLRVFDELLRRAISGLRDEIASVEEWRHRSWSLQRNWAVRQGLNPPAASDGKKTNAICNSHGVPLVIGGHPNVQSCRANYTSAQTNTVLVSNAIGGGKIVVTRVMVTLDKGTTPNVQVIVGLAQSVTPTTVGVAASHPNIDPGGGFVTGDGSGMLAVGNDGDQILVNVTVPTGGSVDVVVSYFILPV